MVGETCTACGAKFKRREVLYGKRPFLFCSSCKKMPKKPGGVEFPGELPGSQRLVASVTKQGRVVVLLSSSTNSDLGFLKAWMELVLRWKKAVANKQRIRKEYMLRSIFPALKETQDDQSVHR